MNLSQHPSSHVLVMGGWCILAGSQAVLIALEFKVWRCEI